MQSRSHLPLCYSCFKAAYTYGRVMFTGTTAGLGTVELVVLTTGSAGRDNSSGSVMLATADTSASEDVSITSM